MRIDHLVTSGKFKLEGNEWDVDNNVFIVGDQDCWIIDPSHEFDTIVGAVENRNVKGIILTHGHSDHVDIAPQVADHFGVEMYMHPDDEMLWEEANGDRSFARLADGDTFDVEGSTLKVLHTPGHSPGSCVLYCEDEAKIFAGDTLFSGGPGATDKKYSDFGTIIESLKSKVFTLPDETKVLPGHGDFTTVGEEFLRLDEYIERGY